MENWALKQYWIISSLELHHCVPELHRGLLWGWAGTLTFSIYRYASTYLTFMYITWSDFHLSLYPRRLSATQLVDEAKK
jgi:hypothetical protein